MHFAGTLGMGVAPMSLTGSFAKSAAPSGGIVTSDAVTVNVPAGNDGKLAVANQSDTGTVALEFERNASGTWVDGSLLTTVASRRHRRRNVKVTTQKRQRFSAMGSAAPQPRAEVQAGSRASRPLGKGL